MLISKAFELVFESIIQKAGVPSTFIDAKVKNMCHEAPTLELKAGVVRETVVKLNRMVETNAQIAQAFDISDLLDEITRAIVSVATEKQQKLSKINDFPDLVQLVFALFMIIYVDAELPATTQGPPVVIVPMPQHVYDELMKTLHGTDAPGTQGKTLRDIIRGIDPSKGF